MIDGVYETRFSLDIFEGFSFMRPFFGDAVSVQSTQVYRKSAGACGMMMRHNMMSGGILIRGSLLAVFCSIQLEGIIHLDKYYSPNDSFIF